MQKINASYMRYAVSLTGNIVDAEDIINSSFESILKTYGEDKINIESLMIKTIYRKFIDKTRSDKKFASNVDISDLPIIDETKNAEEEIFDKEKEMAIKEKLKKTLDCLKTLNDKQRSIVSLNCIENKKYSEIAKIMDMPIGTVMSTLSRGRLAIADCVKNYD